jgi:hypothetical protein
LCDFGGVFVGVIDFPSFLSEFFGAFYWCEEAILSCSKTVGISLKISKFIKKNYKNIFNKLFKNYLFLNPRNFIILLLLKIKEV